jgi:hypothetical protein
MDFSVQQNNSQKHHNKTHQNQVWEFPFERGSPMVVFPVLYFGDPGFVCMPVDQQFWCNFS